MCIYCNLRLAALDRHRQRLFGDDVLSVYRTTPVDGEAVAGTFTEHWTAQRVIALTADGSTRSDSGAWQFQIAAAEDWAISQSFMNAVVAVTVGTRRWKVKKVEKPIGRSHIWKIRAEMQ